jgi:ABC-2 type transport system permease protein
MALILIVPIVLMTLIRVSLPEERTLDYFAPAFLGTLALFFVFLLTGISFLRERSQGTMERLMASPVSRIDIVLGYFGGFPCLPQPSL